MGLKNYLKSNKATAAAAAAAAQNPTRQSPIPPMMEKAPARYIDNMEMRHSPRNASSRASLAPSRTDSSFVDDIKHEVMCNYLYQQQCSHLWVSDGSGELEGVLLRKSRNEYMACPPQLVTSVFAQAMATLNCQVSLLSPGLSSGIRYLHQGRWP